MPGSHQSSLLNRSQWVSQWVSHWQAFPMIGLGSDKNTPHDMMRFESPMEIMFSKCNYSIPAFDSHFSPSKHNRFYIRWEKSVFEKDFDKQVFPRRASYLQRSENERRHSKGIPTVILSQPLLSKLKYQIHCSCTMFNAYCITGQSSPSNPEKWRPELQIKALFNPTAMRDICNR